jgi:ankyrin repeat protein
MKHLKKYYLWENTNTDKHNISKDQWFNVLYPDTDNIRVKEYIRAGVDVNMRDADGATALMYDDDPEVCKLLIDAGADVDIQDNQGWTALMFSNSPEKIELLINAGADMTIKNKFGSDFIDIIIKTIIPKNKIWLGSEEAQDMILSKEPSMIKSFKRNKIEIQPNIQKKYPHLLSGTDLNLL